MSPYRQHFVKPHLVFPMLAACWTSACSSTPHFMTPKIAADLTEARLGFPVRKVSASTYWSHRFGHGLKVEVSSPRKPGDYAENFRLELDGASRICAALAGNPNATSWNFLEILYQADYGPVPPASRNVAGAIAVLIHCDDLRALHASHAPPAACQAHWKHVGGVKDQPGSKDLLKWPPPP